MLDSPPVAPAVALGVVQTAQRQVPMSGMLVIAWTLSILALLFAGSSGGTDLTAGLWLVPGTMIGLGATLILFRPAL